MNKKLLTSLILIRVIFAVAAIVGSAVVAGLIAFVVSLMTDDVEIIVNSCLAGVWVMMVLLLAYRARYSYNKRMLEVGNDSSEHAAQLKKRLTKWYTLSIIFSSLIFGYLFFELHHKIINDLNGVSTTTDSSQDMMIWFIKIAVVVGIVTYFVVKAAKGRKARVL